MRRAGLTQAEAAKRTGITRAKVSGVMRIDFLHLSERRLVDCLAWLGYDNEIKVRAAKGAPGHLVFVFAFDS